jgi:hypothetical protein
VDRQETPGDEEGKLQQEHASVVATLGRLSGERGEDESAGPDTQEQHDVQAGIGPLGIEFGPQEE